MNNSHPAFRQPLPAERDTFEASFRRLQQMERRPGGARQMVAEALETTATMLGDTSLAGRLWGLRDHLRVMVEEGRS